MDSGVGINFAPTTDNAANGPRNAALSGVPQAIQVLSLALPRVLGAQSPVPGSLLTGQGGLGQPDAALLHALLKTLGLFGGTRTPMPMPQGPNPIPIPAPGGTRMPQPMPPMPIPDPRVVVGDPGLQAPPPAPGGGIMLPSFGGGFGGRTRQG